MMPALQPLACHPSSRCAAARGVEACARWMDGSGIALLYRVEGDLKRLRIPGARSPARTHELWRHTCFEAFVAAEGPAYREFNFSPSGEWAAYAFRAYRDAEPLPPSMQPHIRVRREADALELYAVIPLHELPPRGPGVRWRIGLCAVIEDSADGLSYWALEHAPGKPDFHRDEAFAFTL